MNHQRWMQKFAIFVCLPTQEGNNHLSVGVDASKYFTFISLFKLHSHHMNLMDSQDHPPRYEPMLTVSAISADELHTVIKSHWVRGTGSSYSSLECAHC